MATDRPLVTQHSSGTRRVLEACVARVADARAAEAAGADRIELSRALDVDGLTPEAGVVEEVCGTCRAPVVVLVRPRPGDFVYGPAEIARMSAEVALMRASGARAVAVGALTPQREVDQAACRALAAAAAGLDLVFHRAFDAAADASAALEAIIGLGFHRVLTSGGAPTALAGAATLCGLVRRAGGRIAIVAAGGIRAATVAEVVRRSGCGQVHGTFRRLPDSRPVASGRGPQVDARARLDVRELAAVRRVLDRVAAGG
ncbi:MAG TPA: copper homeostasis protein CutC [Phycisphaerae bacterium]|nr:copper homeostasis protein CutC [Phycisphaerae bacterium]